MTRTVIGVGGGVMSMMGALGGGAGGSGRIHVTGRQLKTKMGRPSYLRQQQHSVSSRWNGSSFVQVFTYSRFILFYAQFIDSGKPAVDPKR